MRRARSERERGLSIAALLLLALVLHMDQNLPGPNLSQIAQDFELEEDERDDLLGGLVSAPGHLSLNIPQTVQNTLKFRQLR